MALRRRGSIAAPAAMDAGPPATAIVPHQPAMRAIDRAHAAAMAIRGVSDADAIIPYEPNPHRIPAAAPEGERRIVAHEPQVAAILQRVPPAVIARAIVDEPGKSVLRNGVLQMTRELKREFVDVIRKYARVGVHAVKHVALAPLNLPAALESKFAKMDAYIKRREASIRDLRARGEPFRDLSTLEKWVKFLADDETEFRQIVLPGIVSLLQVLVAGVVVAYLHKHGLHALSTAKYGFDTATFPIRRIYQFFMYILSFFIAPGNESQVKDAIQKAINATNATIANATNATVSANATVGHGKKKSTKKVFGKQPSLKNRSIKTMLTELKKIAEGPSSRNSSIVEHPHAYEMPDYVYDYAEKMRR